MVRVIGERVPIHLWADDADEETIAQLRRVARLPFVVAPVCAMADAHVSEGVAVGTVFATEDVVVPGAIGGDIGCGVSAIEMEDVVLGDLETRLADLARAIPAGTRVHREGAPCTLGTLSTKRLDRARKVLAPTHLGTLGGGNHFLEIDRDADGAHWLLVHSGSRGFGAAIAHHHGRVAGGPLAPLEGEARDAYLSDLAIALAFARANREEIARRALDVIGARPLRTIDIHHNFIQREHGFLVHRKGAIWVPRDSLAVVPGSMGTASYIVRGLGCADAFDSCSHGAGRILTRTKARRSIEPRAFRRQMRGVVYSENDRIIEEAPSAYRDIVKVLERQRDLVAREARLEPVLVLKG